MAVHLNRPPHSAFLLAWGRAPDSWWGLVQFSQRVRTPAGVDELPVAAWIPATALTKPGWANTTDVPRVLLTVERSSWPPPTRWPSWYAGPWPDGPLPLPAGVEAVTGPSWRRANR